MNTAVYVMEKWKFSFSLSYLAWDDALGNVRKTVTVFYIGWLTPTMFRFSVPLKCHGSILCCTDHRFYHQVRNLLNIVVIWEKIDAQLSANICSSHRSCLLERLADFNMKRSQAWYKQDYDKKLIQTKWCSWWLHFSWSLSTGDVSSRENSVRKLQ